MKSNCSWFMVLLVTFFKWQLYGNSTSNSRDLIANSYEVRWLILREFTVRIYYHCQNIKSSLAVNFEFHWLESFWRLSTMGWQRQHSVRHLYTNDNYLHTNHVPVHKEPSDYIWPLTELWRRKLRFSFSNAQTITLCPRPTQNPAWPI
jgi:hypothetical protein